MTVEVMAEDARWITGGLDTLFAPAAEAALRHLGLEPAAWDIAILACDDNEIARLNLEFRGKPRPTNVLSWPSAERGAEVPGTRPDPPEQGPDPELGDIAIAYDTTAREAEEAGKTLADHTTHLIVHATLHLLGYDHEEDADAALMEGLEREILATLGVADPY